MNELDLGLSNPERLEQAEPSDPCPLVGMGASAGGLEALETFFQNLPPGFEDGLAFVIVQHLAPTHSSLMPELLARFTRMPVQHVQDRMPVKPKNVYLIPPNTTLRLEGCILRAVSPIWPRHTPIDTFFFSLAEQKGDRAIGLILSGGGSDGTLGLKAIREHGGMSMAQDLALHDSMPRSAIALGVVDYVLPVEQMPAKLFEYVTHIRKVKRNDDSVPPATDPLPDQLRRISVLLQRRTGHDFSRYKQATVVRRIQRRMQVRQAESLGQYVDLLRDPEEADQLFRSLLIGVTHFFRDPEAFDTLGRDIIPALLDAKVPNEEVRVWVAGCSSGEEAYSVAMLLREAAARRDAPVPTMKLFATDIDDAALEVARAGRYPDIIADQVTAERLDRFFIKHAGHYQICKDIRETCIFSVHNLINDPPFSRLDLISCRNVLIYLEGELQQKLVPLFHYALRPGGYVFLGPSESITGHPELFQPKDKKQRIYQRRDSVIPSTVAFPLSDPLRVLRHPPPVAQRAPVTREQSLMKGLEQLLLDEYAPASVVINARGEIVYISGRTSKYLELAPGAPSVNVVDMAKIGLRLDLHTAIRKAAKTGELIVRVNVSVEIDANVQRLNLIVRPLPQLDPSAGLLMVIFQELGPLISREQAELEGAMPRGGDSLTLEMEAELRSTKESLQTSIGELEASNEELKSANEELLSTNEELQSANEELQTSKEELQSINEELQTVNIELHRKVDELDRINGDIQNLFASTQIATLFLDNNLLIKKFSPAATALFRVIESDVGRPITDIVATFTDGDLVADVREVLRTLELRERQVYRADGDRWYIRSIRPYRSLENTIDGVVITFVEITELWRAQARISYLAAIVESAQEAIIGLTLEGMITSWNTGAERLYGYPPCEVIGRSYNVILPDERADELAGRYEQLKRGGYVEPFETKRLCKERTVVSVHVMLSPLVDADGAIVGISEMAQDISQRLLAEEALREADQRKNEFMAMLGHELRNPLAPIRYAAQIIAQSARGEPAVARAQTIIERQVRHMTRLIDDLLDVSRIGRGKILLHKEPTDFVELTRRVVESHESDLEAGGLSLEVELPEEPLYVLGDSARLAQAVDNLVHNAVKFTDKGGRIRVAIGAALGGEEVTLRVRDTGIGIDAGTLARLFEPFVQADHSLARSRGGLGLGLALVKSMVELHGGRVTVESKGLGSGAEFAIHLPQTSAPAPEPTGAPVAMRDKQARRILIIEDNIDAAESLEMLLKIWGHEVAVAHAGVEGVAQAKEFRPEIVLSDIGLPGKLDGYAVARALRADPITASAYLVALTGYGQDEDQQLAVEAGFDQHLTKPINDGVLEKLLDGSG